MQRVSVTGVEATHALEIRTLAATASAADVQVVVPLSQSVHLDDAIRVSFWMRAVDGSARLEFVFGTDDPSGFGTSALHSVRADTEWKQVHLSFPAAADSLPGEARLMFRSGFGPQALQIAGLEWSVSPGSAQAGVSASPPPTYPGDDPDASWRVEARARIERVRKAPLSVQVRDVTGAPVANATVHVRQLRHAFVWGTAVDSAAILEPTRWGEQYRETLRDNFTHAVFESEMKWPSWENPSAREKMFAALAWLEQTGLVVRGHTLVWPGWESPWKLVPDDVRQMAEMEPEPDRENLAVRISDHIRDEASTLRGRVTEWDVVNEAYSQHNVIDVLGEDAIADWFRAARTADPTARLYYNDFTPLTDGAYDRAGYAHYRALVARLQNGGAPLDGLGVQAYFFKRLAPPEQVLKTLDQLAASGLTIQINEFALCFKNEPLQAAYTRDFLTAMFSHPSVTGLLHWGFWEKRIFCPSAALFREDWSLTPHGRAWRDLVYREWWTDVRGVTDPAGRYAVRAFRGSHQVEVQVGDRVKVVEVELGPSGGEVEVVLD